MNVLHCLKSFVTIANHKSFSAAARKLYVSPSKLSKEINWLEDKFKAKLFIRSTRQLSLTKKGELLYIKAVKLLSDFDQLYNITDESTEELQGMIRVYLTVTPAIPYLVDLSLKFMELHPNIEISILVAGELVPMGERFFDLGISFDPIKHPNYNCQFLFNIIRCVYASPAYIEKKGPLASVDQLVKHNCLLNILYNLQNKWILGDTMVQVAGNFQSNNATVLKQAAVEGAGIIWAPPFSVKEEVEKGKLVHLLPHLCSPAIPLYFLVPTYLSSLVSIEALVSFFREQAIKDNYGFLTSSTENNK